MVWCWCTGHWSARLLRVTLQANRKEQFCPEWCANQWDWLENVLSTQVVLFNGKHLLTIMKWDELNLDLPLCLLPLIKKTSRTMQLLARRLKCHCRCLSRSLYTLLRTNKILPTMLRILAYNLNENEIAQSEVSGKLRLISSFQVRRHIGSTHMHHWAFSGKSEWNRAFALSVCMHVCKTDKPRQGR